MSKHQEKFDKIAGKAKSKFQRSKNRTLVKSEGVAPANCVAGIVRISIGRHFYVDSPAIDQSLVVCTIAGSIISRNDETTLVTVGDNVLITIDESRNDDGEVTGSIQMVDKRRNCFSRKSVGVDGQEHVIASNLDLMMLVASARQPKLNKRLIDRFLVTSELNSLEAAICVNKSDLTDLDSIRKDIDVYRQLGHKIFIISAKDNLGLGELIDYLAGKTTLLAGQSGVGKSSILNRILGSDIQKVNDISLKTSKGKHTTSYVRMFDLPLEGKAIDTPGVREFGLVGLEADEVALYFHEFDNYRDNCKYNMCSHIHEPGCAVVEALEQGLIDLDRYESYFNIFNSL